MRYIFYTTVSYKLSTCLNSEVPQMLTSNTEAILNTSNWLTDSVNVFDLAPIIQECKWDIRPAYSFYIISLETGAPASPESYPAHSRSCGVQTSAPASGLTWRRLNQAQGSVPGYRINHDFPFFSINAKMYGCQQKRPDMHRTT